MLKVDLDTCDVRLAGCQFNRNVGFINLLDKGAEGALPGSLCFYPFALLFCGRVFTVRYFSCDLFCFGPGALWCDRGCVTDDEALRAAGVAIAVIPRKFARRIDGNAQPLYLVVGYVIANVYYLQLGDCGFRKFLG